MRKYYAICFVTAYAFIMCCTSPQNARNANDSAVVKPTTALLVPAKHKNDSPTETGCVFDTAAYAFTTEKIRAYNSSLAFVWDDVTKEATVALPDNDTLVLHIGGCDHFSFEARYFTDQSKFDDETYLLDKAKWLATTFFSQGYDTKYNEVITNKQYRISPSKSDDDRFYEITDKDSIMTDHIYEGFTFSRARGRAVIWIGGYTN